MAKATPVWDALNEKIEAQQKAMHDTVLELMDFVKSAEMRSISMAERSVVRMHLDAEVPEGNTNGTMGTCGCTLVP